MKDKNESELKEKIAKEMWKETELMHLVVIAYEASAISEDETFEIRNKIKELVKKLEWNL